MKWFISRQCYWGVEEDEANVVEIAQGGLDYANPDMLVSKYSGEGEEYTDPREAVQAAIEIAKQWRKNAPELTISIGHGYTGGMTMPFEADDSDELIKWGNETWEKLPKCDRCGEVLPEEHFTNIETYDKFCSETCAESLEEEDPVEELTGFITQPRYQHDCTACHFLGQYKKYDLYFCPTHEPTVVARFSDRGQDYNSGMVFAVTSPRHHYREAVIRALRIPEFKEKIIDFAKYYSIDDRKERFLELVKIAETDPKDYLLLLGQVKYFMSYIEEHFKEHAEEE